MIYFLYGSFWHQTKILFFPNKKQQFFVATQQLYLKDINIPVQLRQKNAGSGSVWNEYGTGTDPKHLYWHIVMSHVI